MLKLRKGGHKDLEKYYSLMEIDFDSEELFSKLLIHKAMMQGNQELFILYDEESGMELGYALLMVKNIYGYVLLKYLGIMPWVRGKGLGVELMRLINRQYADRQGIVAELTEFPDEDENRLRKLKKFFERFGYEPIACDYTIAGTRANLYVKPIKGTAELAPVAHRIIGDFYSRCMNAFAMNSKIRIGKKKERS